LPEVRGEGIVADGFDKTLVSEVTLFWEEQWRLEGNDYSS
jgi:hypothetical protein